MAFTQHPAYIICILLLLIVFSEWLAKKKFFKHVGSVLIVIIAAAILANCKLLPSSTNAPALYDKIFQYAAPLGIFYLLLGVNLKYLKLAGPSMLFMFIVGSLATIAGVVIGYWMISPQHHQVPQAYAVAGMFTGTYIGGSMNLNAIALHYDVNKNGTLYAAVNVVDNILTTVWIIMTMILPPILQKIFPRKKKLPPEIKSDSIDADRSYLTSETTKTSLTDVALLLALGFGTMYVSYLVTTIVPQVPSILVLTTIALLLAQVPFIQKLQGYRLMGLLLVMIFLAVIGAYCDIFALIKTGETAGTLMIWDTLLILIHGIIIFFIAGLFKQDWDIAAIASNANIGGATTAPVCAASLGRSDLQLPGILAGSVGNAIGTYAGILVAEMLK